jgi:hypothetical protein
VGVKGYRLGGMKLVIRGMYLYIWVRARGIWYVIKDMDYGVWGHG